ncbi:MAG: phage terminase large subunit [Planctomycetes bacterium]|nr:phage terminase large subunit [Planctomycetota bacterium]
MPTEGPAQSLSNVRRSIGAESILQFINTYLPSYRTSPFSRMHEEVATLLEDATKNRGSLLAIAAPRGHAKSTLVTLALVLWCLCYKKERYIAIVSGSAELATTLLASVKKELESNVRLREDFPEACGNPPTLKPGAWRKDQILTVDGRMVSAHGQGGQLRGRRNRQDRPGLIICDDLESDLLVRSSELRQGLETWFNGTLLKMGTGSTNVVVVGTILHHDSLLAKLTDPRPGKTPGWKKAVYRAVEQDADRADLWEHFNAVYNGQETDEHGRSGPEAATGFFESRKEEMLKGSKVLWPEREDYAALMIMKTREGRAAFSAEKQNQPLSPEDAIFRSDEFAFWSDRFASEQELLAFLGDRAEFYGGVDPSLGKAGKNRDDTAIVTIGRDSRDGRFYVLDADIRKRKPSEIIEALIELHRFRDYRMVGVESVQYQEFLAQELQERSRKAGREIPVCQVRSVSDKLGRIQRLQPLVTSGGIQFSRKHVKLLEQMEQFPMAAHDDGPDALEIAIKTAQDLGGTQPFVEFIDLDETDDVAGDERMWKDVTGPYGIQ